MWPTFFIPRCPTRNQVNYDCFFDFTRYDELTRRYSDGVVADPILQFQTEPNTVYFIQGYAKFGSVDRQGGPQLYVGFEHTGDTAAFYEKGGRNEFDTDGTFVTFQATCDNSIGTASLVSTDNANLSVILFPHTVTRFIDAFLVTGATAGTFSMTWGIGNNVAGALKILTGSTIVVRKPLEAI